MSQSLGWKACGASLSVTHSVFPLPLPHTSHPISSFQGVFLGWAGVNWNPPKKCNPDSKVLLESPHRHLFSRWENQGSERRNPLPQVCVAGAGSAFKASPSTPMLCFSGPNYRPYRRSTTHPIFKRFAAIIKANRPDSVIQGEGCGVTKTWVQTSSSHCKLCVKGLPFTSGALRALICKTKIIVLPFSRAVVTIP